MIEMTLEYASFLSEFAESAKCIYMSLPAILRLTFASFLCPGRA